MRSTASPVAMYLRIGTLPCRPRLQTLFAVADALREALHSHLAGIGA